MLATGAVDVKIQGWAIQNFAQGILINTDGGCASFEDVVVSTCETGLKLVDTYQVTIDLTNSQISANQMGIELTAGSSNNLIFPMSTTPTATSTCPASFSQGPIGLLSSMSPMMHRKIAPVRITTTCVNLESTPGMWIFIESSSQAGTPVAFHIPARVITATVGMKMAAKIGTPPSKGVGTLWNLSTQG